MLTHRRSGGGGGVTGSSLTGVPPVVVGTDFRMRSVGRRALEAGRNCREADLPSREVGDEGGVRNRVNMARQRSGHSKGQTHFGHCEATGDRRWWRAMTPPENGHAHRAGRVSSEISSGIISARSMALPTTRKHDFRGVRHQFLADTPKLLNINCPYSGQADL